MKHPPEEKELKEEIEDALLPPLDWDHPKHFPVECPDCGWQGMSNETAGGEPIADTGDYYDTICPRCLKEERRTPVRDIPRPALSPQAHWLDAFECWWHESGSAPKRPDEDWEEHTYRMTKLAWHNATAHAKRNP